MQPYRNVPANQFFPIYWNCQQCSCENCAVAREQGTSACPTASETQRPSFTIESLLSRKGERKPDLNQIGASSLKVTLVPGGSSGQLSNENVSTELIGSDHASRSYLPQFHRPPSQFGLEHASLFGRANIQANGPFLARGDETDWTNEKPKRMRTIFTVEQLERLEREFTRQQYMVGGQRFYLSKQLGLTETQVKVWFQNRRIKWRKQLIEQQRSKVRHQKEPSTSLQVEKTDCS